MTLEEKLYDMHRKAHRVAFAWYIRKGYVPSPLPEIMEATTSVEAFRKFNPYHDELGRFTFAPDGGSEDDNSENTDSGSAVDQAASILQNLFGISPANAAEIGSGQEDTGNSDSGRSSAVPEHVDTFLNSLQTDTASQQPPTGQDPGSKDLLYNDSSTVIDSFNPIDPGAPGKDPLLAPQGVSLANNIETGKSIHDLPSIFQDSTVSKDFFPEKEAAMIKLFWQNQPMDYQRIYSDTDKINTSYIDFGNYNFGVVAAAAGYTSNEALLGAGLRNLYSTVVNSPEQIINALSQSSDKLMALQDQFGKLVNRISGTDFNNPRVEKLILQGFDDYVKGKHDYGAGLTAP